MFSKYVIGALTVGWVLLGLNACNGNNRASGDGGEREGDSDPEGSYDSEVDTTPIPTAEPCPDVGLDGSGAVFYVCNCLEGADPACVAGDDANAGDNPSAPWQTFVKAQGEFANLGPGDTIAFCRGGAFDAAGGGRWVNDTCEAANPCVVRDYLPDDADDTTPKPIITTHDGVFRFEDGGDANHEEGYTVMHLTLRATTTDGQAVFVYNDMDDVLLCDLDIDGFNLGVHVAGSNPPEADSDGINERIELRNSRITNCPGQGFLGACNGCVIAYSYFENNGYGDAVFNHNIYVSGASGAITNGVRVVGNVLYRSAVIDGECQGVSLVVHGEHEDIVISGNTVREDVGAAGGGCWGIAMDTGYDEAEGFRNAVISNNRVINVGNVGIGTNACDNCLVENNVVVFEQAYGGTGIAVPNRDRGEDDLPMTGVTVRNNSVYFGSDQSGTGIRMGGEGQNHVVVSNAVHYAGSHDGFNCFEQDLSPSAYTASDHNLCYHPNAGNAEWANDNGDLTGWQSASGLDANSRVADPEFIDTSLPEYDLAPASEVSPLVDSGHPDLSSGADFNGQPRDDAPDIGAFEWRE